MKELPYNDEIYYQDYDLLISSGREGGMHRPLMQQIQSYKFSMFLVKNPIVNHVSPLEAEKKLVCETTSPKLTPRPPDTCFERLHNPLTLAKTVGALSH